MSEANNPIPDEVVRARSYQIWQREHRPEGRALEHWFRAKTELRLERLQRQPQMPAALGGVYFWDHFG